MSVNRNYYSKPASSASIDVENAIFSTNLSANTTLSDELHAHCVAHQITDPKIMGHIQDQMRVMGYAVTITAYFSAQNKEKPKPPY